MRDAQKVSDELFTYVWDPELFVAEKNQRRISRLVAELEKDFHEIDKLSWGQQHEAGFRAALESQKSMLQDIRMRFDQGKKEYANWRLRGLSRNCIACHTRMKVKHDFFGGERFRKNESPESQLAAAEFLIASRRFEAASDQLFQLARNYSALASSKDIALTALKLWLTIEVRVKDRAQFAARDLEVLVSQSHFKQADLALIEAWRNDLIAIDALEKSNPLELISQRLLLDKEILTEDEKNQQLIKTLVSSTLLHQILDSDQSPDNRSRSLLLLGRVYLDMPIASLRVFAPMYLEQCIREFPGTIDSQLCYQLLESEIRYQATGSSGIHLEDEDVAKLTHLRELTEIKPSQ